MPDLCPQDMALWIIACAEAGLTFEEYAALTVAAERGTMLVN